MFEPQLKHNRDEFERLNRRQNEAVVVGAIPAFVLGAALMLFFYPPAPWVKWVAILYLVAVGGVIGALEIKKTSVFFHDVRERERGASRDER